MPQERDEVQFREPIMAQKDVKARISFAEPTEWHPKDAVKAIGDVADSYKAVKLTVVITDESVRTEHADALPKMVIDDQFNVQRYPYVDSKKGTLAWLNRSKLFDIERALGFDPVFVDKAGNEVAAFVTRTGNKVAPKVEGVAQVLNPSFLSAYFHEDMTVNPTNWVDKEILVDVAIETSEQFGDKNVIKRYKKVASL